MSKIELVVKETDGVEFYTDTKTGQSGISQSGLAILCGVTRDAISKLVNSLYSKKPYKGLEHLIDKLLECRIQTKTGMWLCNDELCVAIIRYYDRKGSEKAQYTFDKFAAIGFNTWVQSITGWQTPPQTQPQQSLPTLEQIEFMKSRAWEKAEIEGTPMTHTDIAKAAGIPSSNDSALSLPNDASAMDYAEKMRKQYERIEIERWLERCLQK